MKAFIVLALVFAAAFAAKDVAQSTMDDYTGFTLAEVQQITELRETKWGNIFFTMAELHLAADGPIQKLVTALDDLSRELNKAMTTENQKFEQKKAIHQATINGLNSQVADATAQINANKQKIDGVLKPRLAQAQKDIVSDEKTIKSKDAGLVKAQQQRAADHKVYLDHVKQYNAYIATIDECMNLVNGLRKGKPSLMEIRQVSIAIKSFESQIRNSDFADAPFLAALVAIATSQNFANQESINKVLKMFSEFRAKVAKSLTDEGVADAANEKRFQSFVAQTAKEKTQLQENIRKNTALIATTRKQIDDCNNLILIKTHEVLELKDRIAKENENWRRETNVHNELIAEIKKELSVVKKCRDIFTSAQFSGYVNKKISGKGAKAKKF